MATKAEANKALPAEQAPSEEIQKPQLEVLDGGDDLDLPIESDEQAEKTMLRLVERGEELAQNEENLLEHTTNDLVNRAQREQVRLPDALITEAANDVDELKDEPEKVKMSFVAKVKGAFSKLFERKPNKLDADYQALRAKQAAENPNEAPVDAKALTQKAREEFLDLEEQGRAAMAETAQQLGEQQAKEIAERVKTHGWQLPDFKKARINIYTSDRKEMAKMLSKKDFAILEKIIELTADGSSREVNNANVVNYLQTTGQQMSPELVFFLNEGMGKKELENYAYDRMSKTKDLSKKDFELFNHIINIAAGNPDRAQARAEIAQYLNTTEQELSPELISFMSEDMGRSNHAQRGTSLKDLIPSEVEVASANLDTKKLNDLYAAIHAEDAAPEGSAEQTAAQETINKLLDEMNIDFDSDAFAVILKNALKPAAAKSKPAPARFVGGVHVPAEKTSTQEPAAAEAPATKVTTPEKVAGVDIAKLNDITFLIGEYDNLTKQFKRAKNATELRKAKEEREYIGQEIEKAVKKLDIDKDQLNEVIAYTLKKNEPTFDADELDSIALTDDENIIAADPSAKHADKSLKIDSPTWRALTTKEQRKLYKILVLDEGAKQHTELNKLLAQAAKADTELSPKMMAHLRELGFVRPDGSVDTGSAVVQNAVDATFPTKNIDIEAYKKSAEPLRNIETIEAEGPDMEVDDDSFKPGKMQRLNKHMPGVHTVEDGAVEEEEIIPTKPKLSEGPNLAAFDAATRQEEEVMARDAEKGERRSKATAEAMLKKLSGDKKVTTTIMKKALANITLPAVKNEFLAKALPLMAVKNSAGALSLLHEISNPALLDVAKKGIQAADTAKVLKPEEDSMSARADAVMAKVFGVKVGDYIGPDDLKKHAKKLDAAYRADAVTKRKEKQADVYRAYERAQDMYNAGDIHTITDLRQELATIADPDEQDRFLFMVALDKNLSKKIQNSFGATIPRRKIISLVNDQNVAAALTERAKLAFPDGLSVPATLPDYIDMNASKAKLKQALQGKLKGTPTEDIINLRPGYEDTYVDDLKHVGKAVITEEIDEKSPSNGKDTKDDLGAKAHRSKVTSEHSPASKNKKQKTPAKRPEPDLTPLPKPIWSLRPGVDNVIKKMTLPPDIKPFKRDENNNIIDDENDGAAQTPSKSAQK